MSDGDRILALETRCGSMEREMVRLAVEAAHMTAMLQSMKTTHEDVRDMLAQAKGAKRTLSGIWAAVTVLTGVIVWALGQYGRIHG